MVTVLLIVINVVRVLPGAAAAATTRSSELRFNYSYAAIPCEVVDGEPLSEEEVVRTLERGRHRGLRPRRRRRRRCSPTRTCTWRSSTRCSCTGACSTSPATCSSSGSSATTSRTGSGIPALPRLLPGRGGGGQRGPHPRPAQQHHPGGRRVGRGRGGDGRLPGALPQRPDPHAPGLLLHRRRPGQVAARLLVRHPVLHQPVGRGGLGGPRRRVRLRRPGGPRCSATGCGRRPTSTPAY